MKSFKYLAMVILAGMLSFTVTSCLGDDDNDDVKINPFYYTTLSGAYSSGFVKYKITVDETSEIKETSGISTTITTDSVLRVTGLPVNLFTKNISDKAIRDALEALPNPVLKARYLIYTASDEGIGISVTPEPLKFNAVTVDGKVHDYMINFYIPSPGATDADVKKIGFNVYLASLYEDNVEKQKFSNSGVITDDLTLYIECSR